MILAIKTGFKKGVDTTIKVGKILIPVYFIVTFISCERSTFES